MTQSIWKSQYRHQISLLLYANSNTLQGAFAYQQRVDYYYAVDELSTFTALRLYTARPISSFYIDIRYVFPRYNLIYKHYTALYWLDEARSPIPADVSQAVFTMCYSNGRIPFNLPQRLYPTLLKDLLTETGIGRGGKVVRTPKSSTFHQNIRHYNNSFTFTSIGCGGQNERLLGNGLPTFRI